MSADGFLDGNEILFDDGFVSTACADMSRQPFGAFAAVVYRLRPFSERNVMRNEIQNIHKMRRERKLEISIKIFIAENRRDRGEDNFMHRAGVFPDGNILLKVL